MEFHEWFSLKSRNSFTIDPIVNYDDARFYFGRHELQNQLMSQLKRSFIDPKTPKLIIFGPYGSGKTQLLYHLDYQLKNKPPETCTLSPYIVHLNLEMKSKSDHKHFHLQLLEALGKNIVTEWVENISKKVANIGNELDKIFTDNNVSESIRKLLIGGLEHTAWRWLCGYELGPKDLEQLKVTRNLGSIGAGEMARTLVAIGKLAEENHNKLIFMIDEAERFNALKSGDGINYIEDYLRELSEKSNMYTGFMIAGTAQALDDIPSVFQSQAIVRRIGKNNYVDIPFLSAVSDVKIFLKELLDELIDKDIAEKKIRDNSLICSLETYPFNSDSFDLLCQFATEDPTKALPSNLINCINECAISTWDEKKYLIENEAVNQIAPLIFG